MFFMKKNLLKGMCISILCAVVLTAFAGCGEEDSFDSYGRGSGGGMSSGYVGAPGSDRTQPQQENGEEEIAVEEDVTADKGEKTAVNPLNGKACDEDVANTRPVVFIINNIKEALPQVGISEAEVVYEVLAEGGITRLVAVYNDYKKIPEIGSVRSARDYCIDIADAHDGIFVHAGQSESAKDTLIKRKTNNINGEYMYRSAERRKTMAYEHTLMMSGSELAKAIKAKGYRSTSDKEQPLAFYESEITPKGEKAVFVSIPFTMAKRNDPYAVSFFNYDENSGLYCKGHYDGDHIDGDDGRILCYKNVLILECAHTSTGDAEGHIDVNFKGTGKGKYLTMGKYNDIVWERKSNTSSYTLYESDGKTPLKINPGKSYIALVPKGSDIELK